MDIRKTPGDKSRILERLRDRYVKDSFLLSVRYPYSRGSKTPSVDGLVITGIKRQVWTEVRDHDLHIFTDPLVSPTGFPFKVVELPGTLSQIEVYEARPRACTLGYLRVPYLRDDGRVSYRCASEPVAAYQVPNRVYKEQ